MTTPKPRLLIVETSDRIGQVALAEGSQIVQSRTLNESRRNARDLAPAVADMLQAQEWKPRDVHAVVVSRGPGSYTGLRVGIMSAKTFAYATGCRLLAIETFLAIASQTPAAIERVDVLADAQQDKVYFQPFALQGQAWAALAPLTICPFTEWLNRRDASAAVSGPGLVKWAKAVPPEVAQLDAALWQPTPATLLGLGLPRFAAGENDDLLSLEPLYLRPSSAEEQWQKRKQSS
jgi:tRNA threonylcarbamoyladenosine biosynthesis protein TsaB